MHKPAMHSSGSATPIEGLGFLPCLGPLEFLTELLELAARCGRSGSGSADPLAAGVALIRSGLLRALAYRLSIALVRPALVKPPAPGRAPAPL
jgi:hypothetical protein